MSVHVRNITNEELDAMIEEHKRLNPELPIRPDIKDALDNYAFKGRGLGHFLTAVVENNLSEAISRADSYNRATLAQIIIYLYNELPASCWGNPDKVRLHYEKFHSPAE